MSQTDQLYSTVNDYVNLQPSFPQMLHVGGYKLKVFFYFYNKV